MANMQDNFGREINYMRISITDRCNLRCAYCMPDGIKGLPHSDILRYEEILRIAKATAELGISNIKVTGGEPFVRKGVLQFLQELKQIPKINRVTITTNGLLLGQNINELLKIGIDGINVSLDSLKAPTYHKLTGGGSVETVIEAIKNAAYAGHKVKINCVPIRGVNDSEIVDITKLAESLPIDIRFIEYMPSNSQNFARVTGAEIINILKETYPDLLPDTSYHGQGPAKYFKSPKMQGSVGIIDAFESPNGCFCPSCNRVRLTSDGFLKLCLFHEKGINLRNIIRNGATDQELQNTISHALKQKPEQHDFGNIKNMSQIGG